MEMNVTHSLLLVFVIAGVTILLRFAPFLIFSKGIPEKISYLGRVLPCAIMGMLVVYCLKNTSLVKSPHGLPEILAVALVVALHKWKHNSLISIGVGTVFYMVLVQMVFV